MSLAQLFQTAVDSLPPKDRLRLATMLLETISPHVLVNDSEEWTEEDMTEYREATRRRLAARLESEEGV